MAEVGIDISRHRSKSVDELADEHFDLVITVCDRANQQCPIFPGSVRIMHLGFSDPARATGSEDDIMAAFRQVRDEMRQKLLPLLEQEVEEQKRL
jgi:arsenate reductase